MSIFQDDPEKTMIMTISQDDPEKIMRNDKFEVVDSFLHLSDSISQSGGCFDATTASDLVTWSSLEESESSLDEFPVCFQY